MAKPKPSYRRGQTFGSWRLTRHINSGGNGEVWEVTNSLGETRAIKILIKDKAVARSRFAAEVVALRTNQDIRGVLPVLDAHLPEHSVESMPWYVMPLAVPLTSAIANASIESIVDSFISLADALAVLHDRNHAHRDIKPGNLLYLNGSACLGDFGLVDYPDKQDVTRRGEAVGPTWTIAPEMRRGAAEADGRPADVYSLAKSLWIFITGEERSFDGQYNRSGTLAIGRKRRNLYTHPLDDLIEAATDNDPTKRPSAAEFAAVLREWRRVQGDFQLQNPRQWEVLLKRLFPTAIPRRAVWQGLDDIVAVLNQVGAEAALNHMLLPKGGGLDLTRATISGEPGCIELVGDPHAVLIVKPISLSFEAVDADPEWAYFRLETARLEPAILQSEDDRFGWEEVFEIGPGLYAQMLPDDEDTSETVGFHRVRDVARHFGGAFLFVQKSSFYNVTLDSYGGDHATVSPDEFRTFMEEAARLVRIARTPPSQSVSESQVEDATGELGEDLG